MPRAPESLIRLRDVCARTSLSRSSIYRLMDEGRFPRPLKLGPTQQSAALFRASDVQRWIANPQRARVA